MIAQRVRTRKMRASDVTTVVKMMKAFAAFFGDRTRVTADSLHLCCLGQKRTATIMLAIDARKPVGFAIIRDWVNVYLNAKCRHIDFLFVMERHRCCGIGSDLIRAVAQDALKKGCARLTIDAAADNKAVQNLYERLGFKRRVDSSTNYCLSVVDLHALAGHNRLALKEPIRTRRAAAFQHSNRRALAVREQKVCKRKENSETQATSRDRIHFASISSS